MEGKKGRLVLTNVFTLTTLILADGFIFWLNLSKILWGTQEDEGRQELSLLKCVNGSVLAFLKCMDVRIGHPKVYENLHMDSPKWYIQFRMVPPQFPTQPSH